MAQKINSASSSSLAKELKTPLKLISTRTHKMIDDYKSRDFEYISYKDFKKLMSALEQVHFQVNHCTQLVEKALKLKSSPVSKSK